MAKVCSVPGCSGAVVGWGWCSMHYRRWKKTGVVGGASPQIARRGAPMAYLREHMNSGCSYPWPFARAGNGYAHLSVDGEVVLASRYVCELKNGPPPSDQHEAAHACGKGHLGCFNADCLRWATPVENNADKKLHGTHVDGEQHAMARLTEPEVREIRRLRGKLTQDAIATLFGISTSHVSHIQTRQAWAWLD